MGRPTKYSDDMVAKAEEYIKGTGREQTTLPSIEGLADYLDLDDETVTIWESEVYPADYPEEALRGELKHLDFSATIKRIRRLQKMQLMNDGLYGGKEVNSTMAIFLLKANHNMIETSHVDVTTKGQRVGSAEVTQTLRDILNEKDADPKENQSDQETS